MSSAPFHQHLTARTAKKRGGLHVAAKKFVGSALALSLGLAGLTVAFTGATLVTTKTPANAVAGAPFSCSDPRFFAQAGDANSTTLYEGRYDAEGKSVWTALPNGTVAAASNNLYNAVAFNPVDSFLYGTTFGTTGVRGKFVRIDEDGGVTNLGTSAPDALSSKTYSTLWDAGEFDSDGNYYVASGNSGSGSTIYKISGLADAPGTAPTLQEIALVGTTPRYADLTFKAGYLWTASYGVSSTIYRIDVNGISSPAGTVTPFAVPSTVLPTASFGSVFTMTNGNLAFIASNANMYQVSVTDPATSTPTFEQVSKVAAPTNAYSDATNCSTAAIAGLSATKTGPATVLPGDPITWQITVKNNGPGTSSGFVLTDLLPSGLSDITAVSADSGCAVNGTATITCNGGRLLKDETAKVTVTATAPMILGSIVNKVKVVGNEDPAPEPVFSAAPTTVGVATSADDPLTVPPPDGATATEATSVEGGTIALDGGNLVYTPPPGFSGQDTFTYTNTAGDPATMYVTVRPLAGPYAASTPADTSVTVAATTLLARGTGTGRTLTAVSAPVNGTVSLVSGDAVFVPTTGFSGAGSFDYEVTDAAGQKVTATVTVAVTPVAAPSTATTPSNLTVTVPASGLVAGTGSGLTVTAVSAPVNGTVSLVAGNPVFVPDAEFSGTASFDYRVTDASSQTATATVTVTVTPVAVITTATASAGVPTPIDVVTAAHGSSLSVTDAHGPTHGAVTVNGDGDIVYTSDAAFSGTDTFSYTLTGDGGSDTKTVTATVNPLAPNDVAITHAEQPLVIDVLANDTGASLVITGTSTPAKGGSVTITANRIRYQPPTGFSGIDTFSYTATDAGGTTMTATVTVNVAPVIAATGPAGTAKAIAGTPTVFDPAGDATGTDVTLLAVGTASHGVTVVNPEGTLTYTSAAGYSGTDQFAYTLTDAAGQTITGTLVVTVQFATLSLPFTGAAPLPLVLLGLLLLGGGFASLLLRRARRRTGRHALR